MLIWWHLGMIKFIRHKCNYIHISLYLMIHDARESTGVSLTWITWHVLNVNHMGRPKLWPHFSKFSKCRHAGCFFYEIVSFSYFFVVFLLSLHDLIDWYVNTPTQTPILCFFEIKYGEIIRKHLNFEKKNCANFLGIRKSREMFVIFNVILLLSQ